jgi:hypothetical protein
MGVLFRGVGSPLGVLHQLIIKRVWVPFWGVPLGERKTLCAEEIL